MIISREELTMSDELLVWGIQAGQPLWPPVFVNLETRSNRRGGGCAGCWVGGPGGPGSPHPGPPSIVKPDAPRLFPDVDFSEDDPLEATVQWTPPAWPPHKALVCQFHYRRCQEMAWTLVSVRGPFLPTSPRQSLGPPPLNQRPAQNTLTGPESVCLSHKRPICASYSAPLPAKYTNSRQSRS